MSKRISKELNGVINNYKSCFNCINFKIKPLKYNKSNTEINIDFKLTKNTGRCVKSLFNTNIHVGASVISKTNRPVILRDALKSFVRYKTMAETCSGYESDFIPIVKSKITKNVRRVKYKLVKYLF